MKTVNWDGCIFDIGGVLVRTNDAIISSIKLTFRENGLTIPSSEFIISNFGVGSFNNIRRCVEKVYQGDHLIKIISDCYEFYKGIFPGKYINELELLPNVIYTLKKLKKRGFSLGCQTGFTDSETQIILTHFDLKKYFSYIVTSDDVAESRPDPESMYLILTKMGLAKEKCLYIGDTPADIEFAKNAGVSIACITTGGQPRKKLVKLHPDYLIEDISQILRLVS
jgi:pyrophosphatase PpaX